ncbi:4'-phosphopantetheinyl transferase family protein [Streptomyces sp. NPDC001139]
MLKELLHPLAVAETFGDQTDPPALFAEEERLVASAVPARRREFATVRACARTALGQLGIRPGPVLHDARGAPVRPDEVVGSMTHCAGYRAAAVAYAADVVTIGLDAEPNRPLPGRDVLEMITVAEERAQLLELAVRRPEVCWDRLVFSAKESVYKAWYPLTGRWLDFHHAVVTVDPDTAAFTARLLVPASGMAGHHRPGFRGRWAVGHGLLATAIAVHRDPGSRRIDNSGGGRE